MSVTSADERTPLLSDSGTIIVQLDKDPSDYEPIFAEDSCSVLSLEELLYYKDDPWWMSLRRTMFYSFWFSLLVVMASAFLLSAMHLQSDSCRTENANKVLPPTPLSTTNRNDVLGALGVAKLAS